LDLRTWLEKTVPSALQEPIRWSWRLGREGQFAVRNFLAQPHPDPIFALGNQKSGTSAIAALLGMATNLSTTIDLRREVGKQTYPRIVSGELEFDELIRRNPLDFSRAIIKEPNLTLFYTELRARYPESRFVFVVRDPRDNIRSILDRLRIAGDLTRLEASHMHHVDPGFALVLDGRWCGIEGGEHYIDRLAERWNACADVYLSCADEIRLLRYEDFRADKRGAIEQLARHLGCRVSRDISDKVDIQFQQPGRHAVAWDVFFANNLRRIEARCSERMREFGYEPG
jgi:hypothetical protein